MKKFSRGISALLFAAVIGLGLGGCGSGESVGVENAPAPAQPSTVIVKTGSLSTDSWGYTGIAPVQVASPGTASVLLQGHTLLADASHSVVSGPSSTKVSFSRDITNLTATAQGAAPPNFLCYLNLSLGSAATAYPEASVSVDAGAVPGETLKLYNFDPTAGKWTLVQTVAADSSGKVLFPASRLTLWGVFR